VTAAGLLPIEPLFSFDTSAFINGRWDIFKPPMFEPIWEEIGNMIERGQVLAVDEVKVELGRKDDEVLAWTRTKRGLFVPLEHDIQQATKEVLRACPRLMAQHGANRNSADPFVVGLALARGGTVVTQETPGRSDRKPRIPDACAAVGVECQTLPDFVANQDWQLTLGRP
jgi:hypothetical protein